MMKLDKYDLAMANVASKSEGGTPILQNLHLTRGRIEAIDGFILATRDLDLQDGEEKPEVLIPTKMLRGIKPRGKDQALLAINGNSAIVTYQNEKGKVLEFEPTFSFATYGSGSTYPNIDALLKSSNTEKTAHVALSVGFLKKLLTSLPDDGILRLGITAPTKPVEFECGNMDRPIRGLIMPMFTNWDNFQWHREKEGVKVDEDTRVGTDGA